jgi:hypothetical protein
MVEVKKLTRGTVELLNTIQQQNALLGELLLYQKQTASATCLQAQWAQPMMNYLGHIAHALEAMREGGLGSGSSVSGDTGSVSGQNRDKGKGNKRNKEKKLRMEGETETGMGMGTEMRTRMRTEIRMEVRTGMRQWGSQCNYGKRNVFFLFFFLMFLFGISGIQGSRFRRQEK